MVKSPIVLRSFTFLALAGILGGADAFQFQGQQRGAQFCQLKTAYPSSQTTPVTRRGTKLTVSENSSNRNSNLQLGALPVAMTTIVSSSLEGVGSPSFNVLPKILRAATLVIMGVLAAFPRIRQQIFWPGLIYPTTTTNGNTKAELLPGPMGCPFIGSPFMLGNKPSYGAGSFYRTQAAKLGKALGKVPRIWRYYFMGMNFAVLSGGKTFQKIMSMEFDGSLTSSGVELIKAGLLSTKSILFEPDKKRHSYLRRLVGAALTPAEVSRSAPNLQVAAEEQVSKMKAARDNNEKVSFQQICTDYTSDVAWRQILGLELPEEEIHYFKEQAGSWTKSIMSLRILFGVAVESSPGYKALEYIISKIEERIDDLLEQGPDNKSTLSGMIFASDNEDDGTQIRKNLSREEIIDNALLLMYAGSETSATVLTNAMLFLGLHPSVWNKLTKEQETIMTKEGDVMTMANLDVNNAPYLDAVIKESLRMRTVVGGLPRKVLKDIDVNGDGKTIIPKGWLIDPSVLITHEEDPSTKLPDAMHMDAIQGFRPERWLESDNTFETPSGEWYVPFGHGPRHCLGKTLAMLEMKIFLATMVRKLDFPKLAMLPENYDYSPDKKSPKDPNYFSVEWSTKGAAIPSAKDGVMADVAIR